MQALCTAALYLGLNICDTSSVIITPVVEQKFNEHVAAYGLSYATPEERQFRLEQFAVKEAEMAVINSENGSFQVGHNKFSTWTQQEYEGLLGYEKPAYLQSAPRNSTHLDDSNLPESIDWRTEGAVNGVKNQGQCGSCWAFSATASIEGHHFLATGDLLNLAEQQLVDCSKTNLGCNGGLQERAFKYFEKNEQMLTSDYPYTGQKGTCTYDSNEGKVEVKSYTLVEADSIDQLKAAIVQGPTSVTIEADKTVFQMYKSGIFDSTKCGTSLDHAVTAVGYGAEDGVGYYIVRNSWGADWGEDGYIRIAEVDGQGICGIQMDSLFATTN